MRPRVCTWCSLPGEGRRSGSGRRDRASGNAEVGTRNWDAVSERCSAFRVPQLFELLPPGRTGVTFTNRLPDDSAFNILTYMYYYDGGGVAVGDVNNDGLPDLYFTSNVGPNRLYLNKGAYRFEDVTDRAGVADSDGWKTGVTMADVNGDGFVDIYVSGVDFLTMHGHNVLYINNGDGT